MKRIALQDMTEEQLVDRFAEIALDQDDALLMDEMRKYTRLYHEMEALEQELNGRAGDERRLLLPLLDHRNAHVRLKAALATLAVAPEAARNALQRISDENEYPQAMEARTMMDALDAGRYVPS